MLSRHFHELLAIAVDAQTHTARILRTFRLDMNVRRAAVVRLDDQLIDQSDDAGIRFVDLGNITLFFLVLDFPFAFAEGLDDPGEIVAAARWSADVEFLAVARCDIGEDLVLHPDPEVVTRREIHRADAVESRQVLRIVDSDDEHARPPLDRRADVLFPHVGTDAFAHVGWNGLLAVVAEELRSVKGGQRFSDLVFRNAELLDEHFLDRSVVHARVRDRLLDVFLRDDSFVDERAELRRLRCARRTMLVIKRDPENARDLFGAVFVQRRERRAVTFVDQLHDAEEVLFEHDGDAENGLRAETGLLVPALIEAKIRMELLQLRGVVGVANVDGLARERGESGDRCE